MIQFNPHHYKILMGAMFSCFILSGCQTMSAGECQTADWYKLGQQDGNAGQNDNIGQRIDSCTTHHVAIDPNSVNAYRAGYAQGARNYCQPSRITDEAIAGRNHLDICPLELQNGLRPFSQAGSRIYRANQNISRINDEQKRLDDELTNKQTTDKRAWEIRRRQLQLSADLQNAMIELTQARITLGTLYR